MKLRIFGKDIEPTPSGETWKVSVGPYWVILFANGDGRYGWSWAYKPFEGYKDPNPPFSGFDSTPEGAAARVESSIASDFQYRFGELLPKLHEVVGWLINR